MSENESQPNQFRNLACAGGFYIPLARIVSIAELPHFCGDDDCMIEGRYEIALDAEPAQQIWVLLHERDVILAQLEKYFED